MTLASILALLPASQSLSLDRNALGVFALKIEESKGA